jgi:hypothetical protein
MSGYRETKDSLMSDLSFDHLGIADYHGYWIRRPEQPDAPWVCWSGDAHHGIFRHDTMEEAMQHARNQRANELRSELAELESLGVDGDRRNEALPRHELEARCGTYEDILRTICHHLELPQSESGPADDVRLYDRALGDLDAYSDRADGDLAKNRQLRFAAEANVERILKAAEPIVSAARVLPDPRVLVEGSRLWTIREVAFIKALAAVEHEDFRQFMEAADAVRAAQKHSGVA